MDHERVLDEDRVRAVVRRRHLEHLPTGSTQRLGVAVPLLPGPVEVDGYPPEVGDEALGEPWARPADERRGAVHDHGEW